MLPSIALVFGIEMIRDGGSLAAIFQGLDGGEYWVLLKVRLKVIAGVIERLGYEEPAVLDRLNQREIAISWQHAQILLSQIAPFLDGERKRRWLNIMIEAVSANGALPGGIERFATILDVSPANE